MKIFHWNINKGGREQHFEKIVTTATTHDPDMIIFSEFRKEKAQLSCMVQRSGYDFFTPIDHSRAGNEVAFFCRPQLRMTQNTTLRIPRFEGLALLCESKEMSVLGVFAPEKEKNNSSFHSLVDWLRNDPLRLARKPTVLTGDFNFGIKAAEWNKGMFGREYNIIRHWIDKDAWNDCFDEPNATSMYPPTFRRSRDATTKPGQRWPAGSSRPDHFFYSNYIKADNVQVLTGKIAQGLSDHEPMIGQFTAIDDRERDNGPN